MSTLVIIAALLAVGHCVSYDTDYDQNFVYSCPDGEYLKTIESVHDNRKEDRVFKFGCQRLTDNPAWVEAQMDKCEWTNYVNDFDQLFEFQCVNDHVITGISSYHDNGKEDRRYKFQCCQPDGYIIRGGNSVHDNG